MMRKALLLLFTAGALFLAAPSFAQVPHENLCGFLGFDYVTNGSSTAVPYIVAGSQYRAVGFVTSFNTTLFPSGTLLPGAEHTFYLEAVAGSTTWDGTNLLVYFADHARIRLYEDPANNGDYGTNPVNATSPSSFTDGTLVLGADVNQLTLFYDYSISSGFFDGTATLDEGSDLGYIAPARRGGWIMSGHAGPPNPSIPVGYANQMSGQIDIPGATPVAHKSWGALKALYR